jgi:hypothetical protein
MSSAEKVEGVGFKGKKNIYTCDKCKGNVVTVDIDRGVTPFMIECKAMTGCKGMMKSSLYRVFDQDMRADYEWYRPSAIEIVESHLQHHVDQGGLLLRKSADASQDRNDG